jgi:hypothetical protein
VGVRGGLADGRRIGAPHRRRLAQVRMVDVDRWPDLPELSVGLAKKWLIRVSGGWQDRLRDNRDAVVGPQAERRTAR